LPFLISGGGEKYRLDFSITVQFSIQRYLLAVQSQNSPLK
jgi:hypothetical protein